jgi:hypothetical protein
MPDDIIRSRMKTVTFSGYWWLPGDEEKLGGTLTFSKRDGAGEN